MYCRMKRHLIINKYVRDFMRFGRRMPVYSLIIYNLK